jgi:hypothetical protein
MARHTRHAHGRRGTHAAARLETRVPRRDGACVHATAQPHAKLCSHASPTAHASGATALEKPRCAAVQPCLAHCDRPTAGVMCQAVMRMRERDPADRETPSRSRLTLSPSRPAVGPVHEAVSGCVDAVGPAVPRGTRPCPADTGCVVRPLAEHAARGPVHEALSMRPCPAASMLAAPFGALHSVLLLHRCCTVAAPSLHRRCTVAAPSLHRRCTVAAPCGARGRRPRAPQCGGAGQGGARMA